MRRLVVFINVDDQSVMTLTRYGDGSFELDDDDGHQWAGVNLAALLGRLENVVGLAA